MFRPVAEKKWVVQSVCLFACHKGSTVYGPEVPLRHIQCEAVKGVIWFLTVDFALGIEAPDYIWKLHGCWFRFNGI
jgi:hypothetical protein